VAGEWNSVFLPQLQPKHVLDNQPANGRESHELNKNGPFVHRTKKNKKKTVGHNWQRTNFSGCN